MTPFDAASAVIKGLSLTTPHGAHDLALFKGDKLVFRATAVRALARELIVPVAAVSAVAVLDAVPEDSAVHLLLRVAAAGLTTAAGKPIPVIAVRVPASATADVDFGGAALRGHTAIVLCQALGRAGVPPTAFLAPDASIFASASGAPSVRAAVRADQGHAFPLRRALAFVKKPALLVPTADVAAVELLRTEGGSASFDAVLHFADPSTPPLELSSLPRPDLAPLRAWMARCGVAVGAGDVDKPVKRGGGGGGGAGERAAARAAPAASPSDAASDDAGSDASSSDGDGEFDPGAVSSSSRDSDDSGSDGSGSGAAAGGGGGGGSDADSGGAKKARLE